MAQHGQQLLTRRNSKLVQLLCVALDMLMRMVTALQSAKVQMRQDARQPRTQVHL